MIIISPNKETSAFGEFYPIESQSDRQEIWNDGWYEVPYNFEDEVNDGFCDYTLSTSLNQRGEKYITSVAKREKQYDIESIKSSKLLDIKSQCQKAIVSGFDADVLGRGSLHYSLTQTKQDDLKVLYAQATSGTSVVLWHDDSRVMHEEYTAEQIISLYLLGQAHAIQCKIRSDGLEQYVVNLLAQNKIFQAKSVSWDTPLPESIQAEVDRQIALMLNKPEGQ